jgi:cytochrome c553
LQNGNDLVYYKPIRTGMPACLKCHGNTETDINAATKAKLNELYPNDLATGYKLNDFRGLWKVEFKRQK